MPIKSTETPHGLFTMEQLRLMFVGLFVFSSFSVSRPFASVQLLVQLTAIHLDIIPKAGFLLRETSIKSAAVICGIIKARILTSTGAKNAVAETLGKNTAFELDAEAEAFYVRLASIMQTGISADQLAGDTLGCVIPRAPFPRHITVSLAYPVCLQNRGKHHAAKRSSHRLLSR